ncbi:hypothetical protein [Flavobacterium aquicola]|uniref:Uncharacterized protein n=1 Tax=Flavobacterium aquicola TaxID=1682742 RepID=A0A3E0DVZ6_9FLAO|nr:hypothetical protein [Flavobacterium aquicola]REG88768.1 hypothetical protein C8P67_1288 [Flavobacterium aquicola]
MKTKIRIGIVILSIIGFGLFSWLTSDWREPFCLTNTKFEKNLWNSDLNSRFCMINDIIESKILINKSKAELFELIGQPFIKGEYFGEEAFQFKTGVKHGPYLHWYLYVSLKNGKVNYVQKSLD